MQMRSALRGGVVAGLAGALAMIGAAPVSAAVRRVPAGPLACSSSTTVVSATALYGASTRQLSATDIPICVTGAVTVTFSGAGSAGCARVGSCADRGTVTWKPDGAGALEIDTYLQHGRRSVNASLALPGFGTTVVSAVAWRTAHGGEATCHDQAADDFGLLQPTVHGGRVRIDLVDADSPMLGTRCAGPLDADVASALPRRTVALSRLRDGRLVLPLTGSGSFTAGGFTGTVDSTLSLRLGAPRRRSTSRHITVPPGAVRQRLILDPYRVVGLRGMTRVTVRGSGHTAACARLGACGVRGTITVPARATHSGTATLVALAPASRPVADLRTALGLASGGAVDGVHVNGVGELATLGLVRAEVRGDGADCRDAVSLTQTVITLVRRADRVIISVAPAHSQAADPLRTRCPGPALGRHVLARVSLPTSVLNQPRVTVHLRGTTFSDGPYALRTDSTVAFNLRRSGPVRVRILPF